jgi:hypothetical protein
VLHEAPSALLRPRPDGSIPTGAALAALDRILEAERALIDRARLLLDMSKLLSMVSAQCAPHHPNPRRPNGAGGGERSEPVRLSVRAHALFTTEVECKMALVRADLFLHSSENFEPHDHT